MADTGTKPIKHVLVTDALAGKVALVTGAARGIGRAIALELAHAGADIALNDLHPAEAAQEALREMLALGRRASIHHADVAERASVESMVQEVIAQYGHIDVLINNAGIQREEPFLEISDGGMQRVLDVDLKGVILCGQIVARQMVRQGNGGRIINISSVHAVSSFRASAVYDAAKAGVARLTATMALELAPYGITVNVIAPGWMETEGTAPFLSVAENMVAANETVPLNRVGNPHEVGQLAAFLCTEAAAYMTGSFIAIDGGYILGR